MPALTPAEVHTRPSWMKMGSQSTISSGCSSASWRARLQWVVTRRPVTSPAAASRKTPLQTDVTRRVVAPAALIQSTSARSARARSTPAPPATTSVSIPPGSSWPTPWLACTGSPLLDRTGPGVRDTTWQSYSADSGLACWNTSYGPVRSSRLEAIEDHEDDAALAHSFRLHPAATVAPRQPPHTSRHHRHHPGRERCPRGSWRSAAGLARAQAASAEDGPRPRTAVCHHQ